MKIYLIILVVVLPVLLLCYALANAGAFPLATPAQYLYLSRGIRNATSITISDTDGATVQSITIQNKGEVERLKRSLHIRRMYQRFSHDMDFLTVTFHSNTGKDFVVHVNSDIHRIAYRNPWSLDANLPEDFYNLIQNNERIRK